MEIVDVTESFLGRKRSESVAGWSDWVSEVPPHRLLEIRWFSDWGQWRLRLW